MAEEIIEGALDFRQELIEAVKKLDTQKFLDKRSEVNDFVKVKDVLELLK